MTSENRECGGGRERKAAWSCNLNLVFKCLHMSAFGHNTSGEQSLTAPRSFPGGNRLCRRQRSTNPSHYQWVRVCGKTRGDRRRGKSDISFWHSTCVGVCVFKNSWACHQGVWLYWRDLGDVMHRIHQSVSRCVWVGAAGLWGVIQSVPIVSVHTHTHTRPPPPPPINTHIGWL